MIFIELWQRDNYRLLIIAYTTVRQYNFWNMGRLFYLIMTKYRFSYGHGA